MLGVCGGPWLTSLQPLQVSSPLSAAFLCLQTPASRAPEIVIMSDNLTNQVGGNSPHDVSPNRDNPNGGSPKGGSPKGGGPILQCVRTIREFVFR